MADGNRIRGRWMGAIGSGALLVSLWLPWYAFRIPAALIDRAESLAGQVGILGPVLQQSAQIARTMGPLHLNAWEVFHQVDVALAVAGAVGGLLALLALAGRANGVGGAIALAGLIAGALVAFRGFSPPGPSGLLHVTYGVYVAALGSLLTLVGGGLEMGAGERADVDLRAWPDTPAPAGADWARTHSVAPPGMS